MLAFIEKVHISNFENLYQGQQILYFAQKVSYILEEYVTNFYEKCGELVCMEVTFLKVFNEEILNFLGRYLNQHVKMEICPYLLKFNKMINYQSFKQKVLKFIEKFQGGEPISISTLKRITKKFQKRKCDKGAAIYDKLLTEIEHVNRIKQNNLIMLNFSKQLFHYCNYKIFIRKFHQKAKLNFILKVQFFICEYKKHDKEQMPTNDILNSSNLMNLINEGQSYNYQGISCFKELVQIFFNFNLFRYELLSIPSYQLNKDPQAYFTRYKNIGIGDEECIKRMTFSLFIFEISKLGQPSKVFDSLLTENEYDNEDCVWDHCNFKRFLFSGIQTITNRTKNDSTL